MTDVDDARSGERQERTVDVPLPVDGAVPPVLDGILVRGGPGDPHGHVGSHLSAGDGMVDAIELRDGGARSYRSRWVRTRTRAARTRTAPPPGPSEPVDSRANANALWHAGRLLALGEHGFPYRLTAGLDTVRVEDFDGTLASPITSHPHLDPGTGGLALSGYDPDGPPLLRYHETDRSGVLVHTAEVDLPRPTAHHDIGVTATRVVLFDLPAVVDQASGADRAGRRAPSAVHWDPEAGARVGVLQRGHGGSDVRWTDVDPCYVTHVANAYDDGDAVVLDVCRYDRFPDDTSSGGMLERWRIAGGNVEATRVDDRPVELPRVDGLLAGRRHRFVYCAEPDGGLARYDLQRDEAARWHPGPLRTAGEPVFIRDPDGHADDEGWVLSVVYDAERDASDLVVLDGSSWGGRPDAVVHLPARLPSGFHGSWVPSADFR